jgi:hypothetical protein
MVLEVLWNAHKASKNTLSIARDEFSENFKLHIPLSIEEVLRGTQTQLLFHFAANKPRRERNHIVNWPSTDLTGLVFLAG